MLIGDAEKDVTNIWWVFNKRRGEFISNDSNNEAKSAPSCWEIPLAHKYCVAEFVAVIGY